MGGKARLRVKIKEQATCIDQKNQRYDEMMKVLNRVKTQKQESLRNSSVVETFWNQLVSDIELILVDLSSEFDETEDEDFSFLKLPTISYKANKSNKKQSSEEFISK